MSIRVLLAMSGGVDSSVAAYILQQRGYDVVGLFMRTGAHTEETGEAASSLANGPSAGCCGTFDGSDRGTETRSHSDSREPYSGLPVVQPGVPGMPGVPRRSNRRGCCSAADAADARRVADRLGIPFYAIDFEPEFEQIIDYFVEEYTIGRTPNPCVMCNNWLKFGRLWEFGQQIGVTHIATGHYARVQDGCLLRAIDPGKDQSYVLFGIRREILPHLLFPIGEYSKSQVREVARTLGLAVAEKPDSQEICFVPSNDYQQLIHKRRPAFDGAGEIVDMAGTVVGQHTGFEGYTVGQRKGLGVALGERRYVVRIEAEQRRVVIGSREDLLGRVLWADQVNWLCDPPTHAFDSAVKIRYLHQPAMATVRPHEGAVAHVEFAEPQTAITPGQAVVFYDGDRLLGGGTICLEPSRMQNALSGGFR